MESRPETLVLLCHHGDWEHRYQASAAAAAAASAGHDVRMVFFFRALEALVDGSWSLPPAPGTLYGGQELATRVEETGVSGPGELLAAARRSDRCSLLACSASLKLVGRQVGELDGVVDEVVGWPTILRLMAAPGRVLYL